MNSMESEKVDEIRDDTKSAIDMVFLAIFGFSMSINGKKYDVTGYSILNRWLIISNFL